MIFSKVAFLILIISVVYCSHKPIKIKAFVSCISKIREFPDLCIVWWGYHSKYNKTKTFEQKFSNCGGYLDDDSNRSSCFLPGRHKFVVKLIINCNKIEENLTKIMWKIKTKNWNVYKLNDYFQLGGKIRTVDEQCHKKDKCKRLECKRIRFEDNKITCKIVNHFNFFVRTQIMNSSHELTKYNLFPIELDHRTTIESFYGYNSTNPTSIGSGIEKQFKYKLKNKIWIIPVVRKHTNKLYYIINADVPNDSTGGSATIIIKYPTTQYGSPLYTEVKDDVDDEFVWDESTKNLTVNMNWDVASSDGFVIKAPKDGCITITLVTAVGISTTTYYIVGVGKSDRRILSSMPFGKNVLCSGCCMSKRPVYTGIEACKRYDRCGICNGDGTTCPKINKCNGVHCKAKIMHQTKCRIHYNLTTDLLYFNVGGLFSNVTTIHYNTTKYENVSASLYGCNLQWTFSDTYYRDNFTWRYLNSSATFHSIKNCLNSGRGVIWIKNTKYKGNETSLLYKVPCKFQIKNTGLGIISSSYTVKPMSCIVKLKELHWLSPTHPKFPVIFFWTTIPNYYDDRCLLINPRVSKFSNYGKEETHIIEWKFIQKKSPTCFNSGEDYTKKCKQSWAIRLKHPLLKKCVKGKLSLKFDRYCPVRHGRPRKLQVVKIDLYVKKICKPNKVKIERKRGCKLYSTGPFLNDHYSRLAHFVPAGERVYYKIKSRHNMEIIYAKICHSKPNYSHHSHRLSCSDEKSKHFVIYDKRLNYKGNMWKTLITPIEHNSLNNTYKYYGFSFKSLLFDEPDGAMTNYVLQIVGSCHKKICAFGSKNLLEDGVGDNTFRGEVEKTWYDYPTECESDDSCTSIGMTIGCGSGHYFHSSMSNHCKKNNAHQCKLPGKCVQHAIYSHEYLIFIIVVVLVLLFSLLSISSCVSYYSNVATVTPPVKQTVNVYNSVKRDTEVENPFSTVSKREAIERGVFKLSSMSENNEDNSLF